jgi:hypothetical protein
VTAYNHRPFLPASFPTLPTRTLTPIPTRTPTPIPTRTRPAVGPNRTPTPIPTRTLTPIPTRTRPAVGPNRVSRSLPRRPHSSLCVVCGGYHRKQHTITLASAFEGRR